MKSGRLKVWLPAIRAGSGADVYTQRLATALEQKGIHSHITWFSKYDELIPLRLMYASPPLGTSIVISNSWGGYAFKRRDIPLVVTVHHAIFESELVQYKNRFQNFYHEHFAEPREAYSLAKADSVIAVSNYVAKQVKSKYGINKIEVISNWVDTEKYKPVPQKPRTLGPFRLLFVGNPTRLKGADMLKPIMSKLGPNFELTITASKKACFWLDLPPNVVPIGRLGEEEMINAYHHCDALLCTSRSEGFGYSVIEAVACGKPVIASNIPALSELFDNGLGIHLCTVGAIDEFVETCRWIASTPYNLARSVENIKKFSSTRQIEDYLRIINDLI